MKYTLNENEIKSQESVLGAIGAGIATIFVSIATTTAAIFLGGFLLISLIVVVAAVAEHKDKKDLENKRKLVEEVKAKIPKEVWNKFIKDVFDLLKDVEKSSKNLVSFVKDQYESVPNSNIVSEGKIDVYNSKKRSDNHPKNVSPKEIQKRLLKDICAEIIASICSEKEFSLTGLEKRNGYLDFCVGSSIKDKYYYASLYLDQNSSKASPSELQKLKENAKIFNEFESGLKACIQVITKSINNNKFSSGFVKGFSIERNYDSINYYFEDRYAYIAGDLDFIFDEVKIKAMIAPIVKIIKENSNTNGDK